MLRAEKPAAVFNDLHGNSDVVHRLRDMMARNHFPQAVILAGPAGSGKYTLALMLAKAMNCLSSTITDGLRDTDKKETRLFVQTHPDVLVVPPDPPQMMIKVDQVRRVIETIYYRPGEA